MLAAVVHRRLQLQQPLVVRRRREKARRRRSKKRRSQTTGHLYNKNWFSNSSCHSRTRGERIMKF
ncbi:unnamed protein product [Heligmosomoides polygyrus]|uniref:Uncharacterized protein n=1 Tax=Heligmosomoides polygyrus TaxID=6339 RepID=A0A3P8B912_HELPZ|nr:unnamed protein product [Heligmosomoides polygyrus]